MKLPPKLKSKQLISYQKIMHRRCQGILIQNLFYILCRGHICHNYHVKNFWIHCICFLAHSILFVINNKWSLSITSSTNMHCALYTVAQHPCFDDSKHQMVRYTDCMLPQQQCLLLLLTMADVPVLIDDTRYKPVPRSRLLVEIDLSPYSVE